MMDTSEFIGSDHIIHAVDSNGNVWPPIIPGGFMNSSNTDPKAKQISDRPNMNENKVVETKNESLWLLQVRQDAIKSKSFRKFGY